MGFPPEPPYLTDPAPSFQPCQIVCLEHETTCLYAEVVQIVAGRQVCWVRPILLADAALAQNPGLPVQWHDLRNGADLLLPAVLFRAAFDTEVIPLLDYLYTAEQAEVSDKADRPGHQQLNQFVRQVWQAHPEAFQS